MLILFWPLESIRTTPIKKLYCYRLAIFAVPHYFVMILGTICSVRKIRIVPTFRLPFLFANNNYM